MPETRGELSKLARRVFILNRSRIVQTRGGSPKLSDLLRRQPLTHPKPPSFVTLNRGPDNGR